MGKAKPQPISINDNVANIIMKLKGDWGEKKITLSTIHILLKECMELVNDLNCPGHEKKQHVMTIVKAVVVDLIEDPDQERLILEIIDKDVLGNTMDLIVMAARGQMCLKNKKTQKQIFSCCKTCIPLLIQGIIQIVKATKSPPAADVVAVTTTTEPEPVTEPENNERV